MSTAAGASAARAEALDAASEQVLADLASGLAGYVREIASVLAVPVEATSFEVSDTVTAYIGLLRRSSVFPDRDLMLLWDRRHGWSVEVESPPAGEPVVLARARGVDPVSLPCVVVSLVEDVVAGHAVCPAKVVFAEDSITLNERLRRYRLR